MDLSRFRRLLQRTGDFGLFAGYRHGERQDRRTIAASQRIRPRFETLEPREVLSSVQGTLFNDANGNGVPDSGEAGLENWTVYLDINRNAIVDAGELIALTDSAGHYSLDTTGQPPSQIGSTSGDWADYVAMQLPGSSEGRWLNSSSTFAFIDRTQEPNAVRNFGAYFQPDVGIAPLGGETMVNLTTAGEQGEAVNRVAVAADSAGNYAIAWRTSAGSGTDTISARIFNADGSPRTGEIPVASFAPISGTYVGPAIAMAGNGRFTVAWNSWAVVRGTTVSSVQARTYAADGTPTGGVITINAANSANGAGLVGVATDFTGNFAIAYGFYKNGTQINVQRYTAAGAANGKAISVASPSTLSPGASIAMDGSGNFVVAWADGGVYAQRFTASGAKTGSQIIVASSNARYSDVAMNRSGQFVVTWFDFQTGLQAAKRYNADGSLSGGSVSFSTALEGPGGNIIGVSIDVAGNAAFTWTDSRQPVIPVAGRSYPYYGVGEVRMRRYTAGGLEPETIVNTTTDGAQYRSGVAATGDGTLVVAWQGYGPSDDVGIYAQRFGPPAANSSTTDTALLLLLMTDPSVSTTRK